MENKLTTEVDWKQEILSWEKSGLSQKKYCQQRQLPYARFVYERSQLVKKNQHKSAGEFLPIKKEAKLSKTESLSSLPALPAGFVLRCPNGYQLAIPAQADALTLNQLLSFIGATAC